MKIQGHTILITGGTSGIGKIMAEEFNKLGNTVIVCGRRFDRLDQIHQENPDLIIRKCDVNIPDEREELCRWIMNKYPDLNILVNNAGVQYAFDLTKPVPIEKVTTEIETNLVAPIHLSSLLADHLGKKDDAAIINISSGLAFVPLAFMPVYCATKAAIHSYSMSLRYQLRNTSVKVFEIIPPSVDTELGHDRRSDKSQSHGGMRVLDFVNEAIEAIKNDVLEAPVAESKGLRSQGESLFSRLNP